MKDKEAFWTAANFWLGCAMFVVFMWISLKWIILHMPGIPTGKLYQAFIILTMLAANQWRWVVNRKNLTISVAMIVQYLILVMLLWFWAD